MNDPKKAAADRCARETINSGHALVGAIVDALPPQGRAELARLTDVPGTAVGLTVRWTRDAVEVRVGTVPDDGSDAITVFEWNVARVDVGSKARTVQLH